MTLNERKLKVELLTNEIAIKEQDAEDAKAEVAKLRKELKKVCTHPNAVDGCGVLVCPDCGYDNS